MLGEKKDGHSNVSSNRELYSWHEPWEGSVYHHSFNLQEEGHSGWVYT